MDSLVSTEWLARELGAGDLAIVDASYHLPDAGRDAAGDYAAAHIPGAVFLDLASLVDPRSPFDNSLPSADSFASRMQRLGIGGGSRIVLYDDSAIKSATRAWYMSTLFGAREAAVLDGGLAKWKAEGRPLATGARTSPPGRFTARPDETKLRSKADLLANLRQPREQVVDARSAGRFTGEERETRAGLACGHIPGARNLHYAKLYNPDGTFKDKAALEAAFEAAGVDLAKPIVTSCGSGMTACALAFALHLIGKGDVALYDGSWAEWGADAETPKAAGSA
jgi:thiosulfate/3-mercaptopyruvate sulfurtransferase